MDNTQAVDLMSFFGQYGVTGIVAVLAAAIVIVFRRLNSVQKELTDTVKVYAEKNLELSEKYAAQSADSTSSLVEVVTRNSKALEDNSALLQQNVELIKEVKDLLKK